MATFLYFTAITLFLLLSIILCLIILVQESKSSGMGSSFGGAAADSLFGTSTADVLKGITTWLAVAFFIACIVLSLWTSSLGRTNQLDTLQPTSEITQ